MTYNLSLLRYYFCVQRICTHILNYQNVKCKHTTSIINCHSYDDTTIPCKRASICHVAVESNLYFSYASVLLHCINTVMTRVVCRPFILIHSFDRNGFLYILFIIKIIQLLLSAFLRCMQIHIQNGSNQWAQ